MKVYVVLQISYGECEGVDSVWATEWDAEARVERMPDDTGYRGEIKECEVQTNE